MGIIYRRLILLFLHCKIIEINLVLHHKHWGQKETLKQQMVTFLN